MIFTYIITNILAIALPSLRISSLIRIATNENLGLLYAAALSFNVVYIQSIGSGIGINSGLFHVTLISHSIETFLYLVGVIILIPWFLHNAPQIREYPLVVLFTLLGGSLLLSSAELFNPQALWGPEIVPDTVCPVLLLSSLPLVKPRRLTKLEQSQFNLSNELEEITIGLLLGDLCAYKYLVNSCLLFAQGTIHKEYLDHLYRLYEAYCPSEPKTNSRAPDKTFFIEIFVEAGASGPGPHFNKN